MSKKTKIVVNLYKTSYEEALVIFALGAWFGIIMTLLISMI